MVDDRVALAQPPVYGSQESAYPGVIAKEKALGWGDSTPDAFDDVKGGLEGVGNAAGSLTPVGINPH
eukprot:3453201-Lingulodinium_polyedra.AAC.1